MSEPTRIERRTDSTASVDRGDRPPPAPIVLHAKGRPARPPSFRLSAGRCVVGAGAGADWVLPDDTISRQHVELELSPEGVRVRDLESRNGTYYLGHRISSITLTGSATLRLGTVDIDVEVDAGSLVAGVAAQDSYGGLVAQSPVMRHLFGILRRVEGSLISVLLSGESGTGKELLARAIHDHSSVARGPWVVVNCGALQRELVRSELFGHRRGAFTGAFESRKGAFQRAHGGTLFLDEVGELPLDVQPVLLRALQQREVVALGEVEPEPAHVRLIAATHRDLEQMVADGTFREDLYYRLKVIRLAVPPLRERPEDIEALAFAAARSCGAAELPARVVEQLVAHPWPGNVRELRHAVEAYVAVGELPLFRKRPVQQLEKLLVDHIDATQPYESLKREFLQTFLSAYLRQLMAYAGGNVSRAAKLSGLERSYLNKLVLQHGLR